MFTKNQVKLVRKKLFCVHKSKNIIASVVGTIFLIQKYEKYDDNAQNYNFMPAYIATKRFTMGNPTVDN